MTLHLVILTHIHTQMIMQIVLSKFNSYLQEEEVKTKQNEEKIF